MTLKQKLKHFLKPDHITVLITVVLMLVNLHLNERILTLIALLFLIFAIIYDYLEI